VARGLEALLLWSDVRGRAASDQRHLAVYRHYADQLSGRADIVIFGHIHRSLDDPSRRPRMIVLGSWRQGSSYFQIDDRVAKLVVVEPVPETSSRESLHNEDRPSPAHLPPLS